MHPQRVPVWYGFLVGNAVTVNGERYRTMIPGPNCNVVDVCLSKNQLSQKYKIYVKNFRYLKHIGCRTGAF